MGVIDDMHELESRMMGLFLAHVRKYHSIQYPPKTAPNDAKPTPTDEELIIVALNSIEYEMRENPSWYTEAIKILHQLIAEVRNPSIFDKINQTNWGQER